MLAHLTFVHALSSLHAGTGQGSGVIDLPIAREKATGLPYLPGSSLKGALRTHCPESFEINMAGRKKTVYRTQIFGSENAENGSNSAGTIQISDQRLLLLPVRSLAGTFAWVTSPYVLRRLLRDLHDLGLNDAPLEVPNTVQELQSCAVDMKVCQLLADTAGQKVYLEDLDLQAHDDPAVAAWADWLAQRLFPVEEEDWRQMLRERLCIVHDDLLGFLLETATEITARIHLKESSKTVKKGGLWYEEALPAETILSGLALATPRPTKPNGASNGKPELTVAELEAVLKALGSQNLQLGGKSTVGRGQCRVRIL